MNLSKSVALLATPSAGLLNEQLPSKGDRTYVRRCRLSRTFLENLFGRRLERIGDPEVSSGASPSREAVYRGCNGSRQVESGRILETDPTIVVISLVEIG